MRVVLSAFRHMDSDFTLDPQWLATLDWVIANARANHLNVVLDEHDYDYCGRDVAGCRGRLMAFWRQAAARYKDQPDDVMFEILNEPNQALTPGIWNAYLAEALAIIRKTNPARTVIVGPAYWNSIDHLDDLVLPENDRNLIVTVHYYTPMRFTHQGASWVSETVGLSGITWGSAADMARLKSDFASARHWADAHHRPIFLGEFGAYDKGGRCRIAPPGPARWRAKPRRIVGRGPIGSSIPISSPTTWARTSGSRRSSARSSRQPGGAVEPGRPGRYLMEAKGISRHGKAARQKEEEHKQEKLEEGLEESFPATDPPSITDPTRAR